MSDEAINMDSMTPQGKKESTTSSGTVTSIKKPEGKSFYTLRINGDYYSKWINDEVDEQTMQNIRGGDSVNFTYTEKVSGDKTFKNIRWIEKVGGNQALGSFGDSPKSQEDWDKLVKQKQDRITFAQALNNAATLMATIAATKDDPEEWLSLASRGPQINARGWIPQRGRTT